MIKLAIIFNDHKLSGLLTRFFTGCYAYHVAWVDEEAGHMYDMNWLRRRRVWPCYDPAHVALFEAPDGITREYMEAKLDTDDATYGWKDYALFALRPLYHLFGRSTRNAGGVICSEMINNDIWGVPAAFRSFIAPPTPWAPGDAPPSPCDLYRWLKDR
jgi:hypothetical protein